MKRLWLFALFASVCYGQTTTYTGTVKDLANNVVTSGRITWQTNAPTISQLPGTGSFVSSTVSCTINAAGAPKSSVDGTSPCVIANNTALTPTGTSYTMCIQPYYVTPGSCIVTYATGGTVDVSTIVPTPATQPSYGVASPAAQNTWTGQQIFNGGVVSNSEMVNGAFNATTTNGIVSACKQAGATADIQIVNAITSLSTGGTVDARCYGATTQTLANSSAITIPSGVTLLCDPATVLNFTGTSSDIFIPSARSTVDSCQITVPANFSGNVFHLRGTTDLSTHSATLRRFIVNGYNNTAAGTAVLFDANDTYPALVFSTVTDYVIHGLTAFAFHAVGTSLHPYINNNFIGRGVIDSGPYAVEMLCSKGDVWRNVLEGVAYEASYQSYTSYTSLNGAVYIHSAGAGGTCNGNLFEGGNVWDMPSYSLTLSSAGNASGGNTTYVGTGIPTTGLTGIYFTVTGFTNPANNGTFVYVSSTATTLTLANASGAAETHAGTATGQGIAVNFGPFIENTWIGGSDGQIVDSTGVYPYMQNNYALNLSWSTPALNLQSVNATFLSTQVGKNQGWVTMTPGDTSHTGLFSWYNPFGTRTGYMGYDTGSAITLQLTSGYNLNIAGGGLQIGGVSAIDSSNGHHAASAQITSLVSAPALKTDGSGNVGAATTNGLGNIELSQTCTTGSIGGSALTAGQTATGTCTVGSSATGHPGVAAASDGSVQGNYLVQVSVSGTTATVTLTAVTAGTPTAKTYNVTVF